MKDIATYIIYVFLLIFVVLGTYWVADRKHGVEHSYTEKPNLNVFHFIILLILSVVIGLRFEVGVDWEGYRTDFLMLKNSPNTSYADQYYEWAFFIINKMFAVAGIGYEWMFFLMALLCWYFIFKSVPLYLLPLTLFFLFTDEFFFSSLNLVRQYVALGLWLCSIRYIVKKDIRRYILMLFLASLFHTSALILIVFYFIPYHKLYNRMVWLSIYLFTILILFLVNLNEIYNQLELLILVLGQNIESVGRYVRYIESGRLVGEEASLGVGFYFRLLMNTLILWFSGDIIKQYPNLKVYFTLFFAGTILFNLFYEFLLLNRINIYFYILRPVVLAMIVFYYRNRLPYRILFMIIMGLYFLLYLGTIYNKSNMCCPYKSVLF